MLSVMRHVKLSCKENQQVGLTKSLLTKSLIRGRGMVLLKGSTNQVEREHKSEGKQGCDHYLLA